MMRKMVMTGGLVLVAAGSSAQLFVAQLITLFYMLLVLKLAPFKSSRDDWLSFIMSVQIMVTLMLGFALKTKNNVNKNDISTGARSSYDNDVLGLLIVFLTGICLLSMALCFLMVVQELANDNLSENKCYNRVMSMYRKCKKVECKVSCNRNKKAKTKTNQKSSAVKPSPKPGAKNNKRGVSVKGVAAGQQRKKRRVR
jgi:hypothetical protein